MITVFSYTNDETVRFAAHELCDTLSAMGIPAAQGEADGDICLGLFPTFGLTPKSDNLTLDDEIAISVTNGKGYIAGSNPRSVLIATYRFLEECGACFVRPGKDGTYLPCLTALPAAVTVREAATKRHRGVCIEGSNSIEHVTNMIEWLPKRGFNSYFIQFRNAHDFFDRWYSNRDNPLKEPAPYSNEQSVIYTAQTVREIKKRGLLLHMVGHGWTCEPFGVEHCGWKEVDPSNVPQSYIDLCALVNGKRTLWKNKPLLINLCYSNPTVRETIVKGVIAYLRENPTVDLLHVWLGDEPDNTCECDKCRQKRLSDYYVILLNEIDEALTEANIPAKIVFLTYLNLLHAPETEKIKNPDRFVLMFAPITRDYTYPFPDTYRITEVAPYEINGFEKMPNRGSVEVNLAFLYQWKQQFSGDCFDYDYHLMWDHLLDVGGEHTARVLHQDIRNFDTLHVSGLISCQLQRNALPSSIAMTTMGKTLWNRNVEFEDIRRTLYAAAFGEDAVSQLEEYFSTLSRCFPVGLVRGTEPCTREELIALMQELIDTIERFVPTVKAHLNDENACRAASWRALLPHGEIYTLCARKLIALAEDDAEKAAEMDAACRRLSWEKQDVLADVMDAHWFDNVIRKRTTPSFK